MSTPLRFLPLQPQIVTGRVRNVLHKKGTFSIDARGLTPNSDWGVLSSQLYHSNSAYPSSWQPQVRARLPIGGEG